MFEKAKNKTILQTRRERKDFEGKTVSGSDTPEEENDYKRFGSYKKAIRTNRKGGEKGVEYRRRIQKRQRSSLSKTDGGRVGRKKLDHPTPFTRGSKRPQRRYNTKFSIKRRGSESPKTMLRIVKAIAGERGPKGGVKKSGTSGERLSRRYQWGRAKRR